MIALVPCDNGAGHLWRLARIAAALAAHSPVEVVLVVTRNQHARLERAGLLKQAGVKLVEVSRWSWMDGLGRREDLPLTCDESFAAILGQADAVVSDNEAWFLPRCDGMRVLLANFLWTDNCPAGMAARDERAGLRAADHVLYLEGLATPGVLQTGRARPIPWVLPTFNGVYGGRRDLLVERLRAGWTAGTRKRGGRVYPRSGDGGVESHEDWHIDRGGAPEVDVVFGRPGVGALHDAMAARRPFIAVSSYCDTFETQWVSSRLRPLGIGISWDLQKVPFSSDTLRAQAHLALTTYAPRVCGGGAEHFRQWLAERLGWGELERGFGW
jgi:hypothetical protein